MLLRLILSTFILCTIVFANKKYCTEISKKQRTTSIYLDISNTNDKQFAINLLDELKNNFLPHEQLQIFTINPVDVSIKQVYSSCVPRLSYEEIKKVKEEGSLKYVLGGNPIDTANEDMTFFMAELKNILINAYKSNVSDTTEKKELIEMFYGENTLFENNPLQRVILYSDMIQNSNDFSTSDIFDNNLNQEKLAEYKTNFNYAEFYIYNGKKKYGVTKHNKLMKFWKDYFEKNNGHVKYFNDQLKLTKIKYLRMKKYKGSLEVDGKTYDSQLFINYTNEKKISNSWFVINEIESIPLKGTVQLSKDNLHQMVLKVDTINKVNHSLFTGDEKIEFKVRGKKIEGIIKLDNTDVILNGKPIKDPKFKVEMREFDA